MFWADLDSLSNQYKLSWLCQRLCGHTPPLYCHCCRIFKGSYIWSRVTEQRNLKIVLAVYFTLMDLSWCYSDMCLPRTFMISVSLYVHTAPRTLDSKRWTKQVQGGVIEPILHSKEGISPIPGSFQLDQDVQLQNGVNVTLATLPLRLLWYRRERPSHLFLQSESDTYATLALLNCLEKGDIVEFQPQRIRNASLGG